MFKPDGLLRAAVCKGAHITVGAEGRVLDPLFAKRVRAEVALEHARLLCGALRRTMIVAADYSANSPTTLLACLL